GSLARVDIMKDGKPLPPVQVAIGQDVPFNFAIDHGGENIFEFSVEPGAKELSLANNSAVAMVNGVRGRLKGLLISGEPHAGARARPASAPGARCLNRIPRSTWSISPFFARRRSRTARPSTSCR